MAWGKDKWLQGKRGRKKKKIEGKTVNKISINQIFPQNKTKCVDFLLHRAQDFSSLITFLKIWVFMKRRGGND